MSNQSINNTVSTELMQYERVSPRAAPRIVAVGVSRFREEMDAVMVDPLTVGGFDPLVDGHRHVQAAQPQRVRDMMAMSPLSGSGKKEKKRSCAPISVEAWMPSFLTRSRGKAARQTAPATQPQLPATPAQPQAVVPTDHVDPVVQQPRPAAIRHLHRSNAVRRPTQPPVEPKPAPCHLRRSNAVRRPTRQESLVPGGEWELGHHPGGEADEYYLAEPVVQRPQLTVTTDPALLGQGDQRRSRDGAGWEEQRMMSYSPLSTTATTSSPSDQETGAHVDASPGVPAAVPASRRFSLDSRSSVGSSNPDDDVHGTVNGASHVPSQVSSLTAVTDVGVPVMRGGSPCSSGGFSPVIRGGSLCSSSSSMVTVDRDEARREAYLALTARESRDSSPPAELDAVDQSLFDEFSGIWIDKQDVQQPPAYEDLAVNPFVPDCVDRVRSARVVDARVRRNGVATGIFQPRPRHPAPQIGLLRPIYMPVRQAMPEFMEDLRLDPTLDGRHMEYRYESAERRARHLAWEAYVVPETEASEEGVERETGGILLPRVDALREEYGVVMDEDDPSGNAELFREVYQLWTGLSFS